VTARIISKGINGRISVDGVPGSTDFFGRIFFIQGIVRQHKFINSYLIINNFLTLHNEFLVNFDG
jgi:hypothetical protein